MPDINADPPSVHPTDDDVPVIASVPLESVICTDVLDRRMSRRADYEAENRALVSLMQETTNSPHNILQKLVETALTLCRAHSAGISLLQEENGRSTFVWRATAGQWARFVGGTMPREFSPCGTVLDRNTSLLMSYPERHFSYYFQDITERKQLEQKARTQLDELENIYRTAPIGLALIDNESRFSRINARMAEINGIPAEQHLGRSLGEIVPDLAHQAEEVFRQVFRTGEPVLNVEFDGETRASGEPGTKAGTRSRTLPATRWPSTSWSRRSPNVSGPSRR